MRRKSMKAHRASRGTQPLSDEVAQARPVPDANLPITGPGVSDLKMARDASCSETNGGQRKEEKRGRNKLTARTL